MIEMLNTLYTLITHIKMTKVLINLNRDCTLSLEHCFGRTHVKSNNFVSIQRFLKYLSKDFEEQFIRADFDLLKIKERVSLFGPAVNPIMKDDELIVLHSRKRYVYHFSNELIYRSINCCDKNPL